MKISPIQLGSPVLENPLEGSSAGPDRLARAKAAAAGQAPQTVQEAKPASDPQVERIQNSVKKIKMRTQVSPDRHLRIEEPAQSQPAETPPVQETAKNDTLDPNEQAPAVSEETKPLAPQYAALARQKRELQIAQKQLEDQKAA